MQHYILLQEATLSFEGEILFGGNPGVPGMKQNKQGTCNIVGPIVIKIKVLMHN